MQYLNIFVLAFWCITNTPYIFTQVLSGFSYVIPSSISQNTIGFIPDALIILNNNNSNITTPDKKQVPSSKKINSFKSTKTPSNLSNIQLVMTETTIHEISTQTFDITAPQNIPEYLYDIALPITDALLPYITQTIQSQHVSYDSYVVENELNNIVLNLLVPLFDEFIYQNNQQFDAYIKESAEKIAELVLNNDIEIINAMNYDVQPDTLYGYDS